MTAAPPLRARHLPAVRREDLAGLRAFVAEACRAAGGSPAACEALVLAADEVCANVVLHAYPSAAPGPLTVAVARVGDDLLVTATDAGPPFDPTRLPPVAEPRTLEERSPGGLGWHLVRQVVDAVRYERLAHGNRVTLVRRAGG